MADFSKMLLFFGADLAGRNAARFLDRAVRSGYTLLALDQSAYAIAIRCGLTPACIEDLLTPEEIMSAMTLGSSWKTSWFDGARQSFTVDGICWPEIDIKAFAFFWRDVGLAFALADALSKRGCTDLALFRSYFLVPMLGPEPSDVPAAIICSRFRGKVRTYYRRELLSGSYLSGGLRRLTARLAARGNRSAAHSPASNPGVLRNAIGLLMAPTQAPRYAALAHESAQRFPNGSATLLTVGGQIQEPSLKYSWPSPIIGGPSPLPASAVPAIQGRFSMSGSPELEQLFMDAFRSHRERPSPGDLREALHALAFHFNYFLRYRWPRLHSNHLPYWRRLFDNAPPAALLVPTCDGIQYLLPAHLCRERNIPVVFIPEAAGRAAVFESVFTAGPILYSNEVQGRILRDSGYSGNATVKCTEILGVDQYYSVQGSVFSEARRFNVLVLTNPVGPANHVQKLVHLKSQEKALVALSAPPPSIADRLEIRIKTHPAATDVDFVDAVAPCLINSVLPANANLEAALEEADVVIGVNYTGSAYVHATSAGKPTIHFVTEPEPLEMKETYKMCLFDEGVWKVRSGEDLWNAVAECWENASATDALIRKALTFTDRAFKDRGAVNLTDFVASLIE